MKNIMYICSVGASTIYNKKLKGFAGWDAPLMAKSFLFIMEEWKNITIGTNVYFISSYGKVVVGLTMKEAKPFMANGYYAVSINSETRSIHRLVAESFIDNNLNKPCINHIDGNKLNNNVMNLEWCTYSENNKHAYDIGLKKPWFTDSFKHPRQKAVSQFNLNGEFIKHFDSMKEAKEHTGAAGITRACKGQIKQSGGFVWKYKDNSMVTK